jgi:hypothetical protein
LPQDNSGLFAGREDQSLRRGDPGRHLDENGPMGQRSPFRAFSANHFVPNDSWHRLERILDENGGCYGLYGTRGSGKSWLMLMAIHRASHKGGLGLWFPCPSEYESEAFLAMLADSLAARVQRDYPRRGKTRRLAKAATTLRERIRFSIRMTRGTGVEVGGSRGPATASLRRTGERELDERPVTIASWVFEFRRLAELITATTGHGLVIGIDELDKIDDPKAFARLLRDIKGIFEIDNVTFLVSVSEEAAAALKTGTLGGRDEFNSSFYTVIELPPLDPTETARLLTNRNTDISERRAHLLCLLAAGNPREIIRLAERTQGLADDNEVLIATMKDEADGLLDKLIVRISEEEPLVTAWRLFPASAFATIEEFTELSARAIHQWDQQDEAWRRLLVRLFVAGTVMKNEDAIADMRDVMAMVARNATVARIMLQERFGPELDRPYRKLPLITGQLPTYHRLIRVRRHVHAVTGP